MIWTLLGRFFLHLLIGGKQTSNYIYNFFCLLTDWYLKRLIVITPKFIPYSLFPIYGVFFFIVFKIIFWIICYKIGWAPRNVIE